MCLIIDTTLLIGKKIQERFIEKGVTKNRVTDIKRGYRYNDVK